MSRAFTLIELLVCIAVIAMLLGILLPGLATSRAGGRSVVCLSNARQLAAALDLYATDADDRYAPAAAGFAANLDRWHGRRATAGEAFDSQRGPLTPYFDSGSQGLGRAVRECPEFAVPLAMLREAGQGFERGCGGYGYNAAFVGTDRTSERRGAGSGSWRGVSAVRSDAVGSQRSRFQDPAGTLAFADGALAMESVAGDVIEYSFAEPRFHPHLAGAARLDPSIHFRHGGAVGRRASIAWLDGHASAEPLEFSWSSGLYVPDAAAVGTGWFGRADDNSVFDYR